MCKCPGVFLFLCTCLSVTFGQRGWWQSSRRVCQASLMFVSVPQLGKAPCQRGHSRSRAGGPQPVPGGGESCWIQFPLRLGLGLDPAVPAQMEPIAPAPAPSAAQLAQAEVPVPGLFPAWHPAHPGHPSLEQIHAGCCA